MIKVNLLPLNLRVVKKKKKKANSVKAAVSVGTVAGIPLHFIAIGAGVLFFLLTAYFDIDYFSLNKKMKLLGVDKSVTEPKIQALKALEQEVNGLLVPEQTFLNTHVLSTEPITSLLQAMSEALPDGMWLESFSMSNAGKDRSFSIKGIAVNIEKQTNIEQIESYLQKLKLVIPTSQFTYSTVKQALKLESATSFIAIYKWQAD